MKKEMLLIYRLVLMMLGLGEFISDLWATIISRCFGAGNRKVSKKRFLNRKTSKTNGAGVDRPQSSPVENQASATAAGSHILRSPLALESRRYNTAVMEMVKRWNGQPSVMIKRMKEERASQQCQKDQWQCSKEVSQVMGLFGSAMATESTMEK
ncbi:hypothetical protein [Absidia glauca]|uniref:Uncharacterized protein n=1 Tax=Absidia glauca TaxID=4829 RepID=A0A163IXQ3_ABSGL|nr:hypothetical protein [Absidia glauca]